MDVLRRTNSQGHIHMKTSLHLSDGIYEMRYLFVVVGLNAVFIVLPHMDNMS